MSINYLGNIDCSSCTEMSQICALEVALAAGGAFSDMTFRGFRVAHCHILRWKPDKSLDKSFKTMSLWPQGVWPEHHFKAALLAGVPVVGTDSKQLDA